MASEVFSTVWLSDVHLGSRACRIGLLLDFLRRTRSDTLYLVGDIIDVESLRRSFYWPESHTEALRLLLKKSQEGTRVVYVPGNHDEDLRALVGVRFGNVEVQRRAVHTTRTGRRLLVLHGDEFDAVLKCGALEALCGCAAYRILLVLNRFVHWLHELLRRPYWSLAQHVKSRIGNAVRYVDKFQRASLRAAADGGFDGVVCGHIHRADLIERDGLVYCNDGDWVESCTAIVEDLDGDLRLVSWRPAVASAAAAVPLRDAA
ncbi:MAG TPA: UDP-2,3-diacylglucosamine diphosphatase [Gammaproteobacteria bacterium]|jgi:UDP-2,3-diacylglucosamine pyrophosphatase LpxH|nr:UDP-2,3-diacylglucosamine diphosphatase [Gammaproteobacteria bacterium]